MPLRATETVSFPARSQMIVNARPPKRKLLSGTVLTDQKSSSLLKDKLVDKTVSSFKFNKQECKIAVSNFQDEPVVIKANFHIVNVYEVEIMEPCTSEPNLKK